MISNNLLFQYFTRVEIFIFNSNKSIFVQMVPGSKTFTIQYDGHNYVTSRIKSLPTKKIYFV